MYCMCEVNNNNNNNNNNNQCPWNILQRSGKEGGGTGEIELTPSRSHYC